MVFSVFKCLEGETVSFFLRGGCRRPLVFRFNCLQGENCVFFFCAGGMGCGVGGGTMCFVFRGLRVCKGNCVLFFHGFVVSDLKCLEGEACNFFCLGGDMCFVVSRLRVWRRKLCQWFLRKGGRTMVSRVLVLCFAASIATARRAYRSRST